MTDDICTNGCARIHSAHVMPGWVCCRCRGYNGLQRTECRNCGHTFCGPCDAKPVEPPEEKP